MRVCKRPADCPERDKAILAVIPPPVGTDRRGFPFEPVHLGEIDAVLEQVQAALAFVPIVRRIILYL